MKLKFNLKKEHLLILAGILILGIVFSIIQFTKASPAAPNPGHSWNQMECDNNFCVNTSSAKVGIGTTEPGEKLDVSGDIRTGGEFRTSSNEGNCPLWKDCDGDGKTGGNGDCNESDATCYVGSPNYTETPDGKDQDCDGVVDNLACTTEKVQHTCTPRGVYTTNWGACDTACKNAGYSCGGTETYAGTIGVNWVGQCEGVEWASNQAGSYQRSVYVCYCYRGPYYH